MLRRALWGMPRAEMLKYLKTFNTIDAQALPETDWTQLRTVCVKNAQLKAAVVPAVSMIAYACPIASVLIKPVYLKILLGWVMYRVVTVPHTYKVFMTMKEIYERNNLGEPE